MAFTLTVLWSIFLLLVAAAWSRRLLHKFPSFAAPAPRWLLSLLPFGAALILFMIWVHVVRSPWWDWNAARVAPTVAWMMGIPMYYPGDVGPAPAFIYPPVSAILRVPVVLLKSPTSQIIAADTINVLTYYFPLVVFVCWTLRSRAPARIGRLMRGIALLMAAGFSLNLASLRYSATVVHADAAAVGFALLACACVMNRHREPARQFLMLILAAICAVLSVGSKQPMVAVLVVLPVYVLIRHGWRDAITISVAEAIFLAVATWLAISVFGYEPLRYSLFENPAIQPWWYEEDGRVVSLLLWSGSLITDAAGPAIAIVIFALLSGRRTPRVNPTDRSIGALQRLRRRVIVSPWLLPLALAIALAPFGILGIAKHGGRENSFTVTTYFLVAALAAMMVGWRPRRRETWQSPASRGIVGASAAMAIALAILCVCPFLQTRGFINQVFNLDRNTTQIAYEFAVRHPQQVYFPRDPLATLLSDHRYYTFEYGMSDIVASNVPFAVERMNANLPPHIQIMATPPEEAANLGRLSLPGFTEPMKIPDLPGWTVYTRPRTTGSTKP